MHRPSRRECGPRKTRLLIDYATSPKGHRRPLSEPFRAFSSLWPVFALLLRGGPDLNEHAGKRSVLCPRRCKQSEKMTKCFSVAMSCFGIAVVRSGGVWVVVIMWEPEVVNVEERENKASIFSQCGIFGFGWGEARVLQQKGKARKWESADRDGTGSCSWCCLCGVVAPSRPGCFPPLPGEPCQRGRFVSSGKEKEREMHVTKMSQNAGESEASHAQPQNRSGPGLRPWAPGG